MTRALLLLLVIGCGPKGTPSSVTSDDAIVVIKSNVKDAQLFVDGRHVASVEALRGGVAVEPGPTVRAPPRGLLLELLELKLGGRSASG